MVKKSKSKTRKTQPRKKVAKKKAAPKARPMKARPMKARPAKARPAKARPAVKPRPVKQSEEELEALEFELELSETGLSAAERAAEIAAEIMGEATAAVAAEDAGLKSPIPPAWLADEAGRELALDSLAAWVVSTLQAAQDDASARQTLRVAIETFYDIREAAQQPRGEFAGHFFIVDAVGLGDSNRPVPWQVLAETVSQERLDRFSALFEEAVREVS